jgi:hypothetical protein
MLKAVNSKFRCIIASALAQAATGRKNEALHLLIQESADPLTKVATAMARAQIYYLDGEYLLALATFDQFVAPAVKDLPLEFTVVTANRNDVRLAMLDFNAVSDYYQNQDLSRTLGLPTEPLLKAAESNEAARREDHREAIPLFWSSLIDAYRSGIWARLQANRERMARECCAVGWFAEATTHAIVSGKDAVEFVANHLLRSADGPAIEAAVASVLSGGHLLYHRAAGSVMIEQLRDVVPDGLLPIVLDWLLEGAGRAPETREVAERVERSWRAILALLYRCSAEQVGRAVDLALQHPILTDFIVQRSTLIRVLEVSVANIDESRLAQVSDVCLDLLGERKHDIDYGTALDLAANIAKKASPVIVARLADTLMPKETPITDLRLGRLAPLLGRKATPETLEKLVETVAGRIRKQVQRTSVGDSPSLNVSSFGAMQRDYGEGRAHILLNGAMIELDAIVAQRESLSSAQARTVAEAALDMIDEPLNLAPNRIALLGALAELSEQMDSNTCRLVFDRLKPHILQEMKYEWEDFAHNPLNPFKLDMDRNDETAGMALYCLARLAGAHPNGLLVPEVESLVASALVGDNKAIRAAAAAAAKLVNLSPAILDGLISNTRDIDPKIATFSYISLSDRSGLSLGESQWKFLAMAVRSSFSQGDSAIRRAAALCIRSLRRTASTPAQEGLLMEIEKMAASDLCFSVRQAIA